MPALYAYSSPRQSHTIPGSENATIHDRYIRTLRRTLDALTEQTRRVEAQAVSNAPTDAR